MDFSCDCAGKAVLHLMSVGSRGYRARLPTHDRLSADHAGCRPGYNATTNTSNGAATLPVGAIVGIVVGLVAGLAILLAIIGEDTSFSA